MSQLIQVVNSGSSSIKYSLLQLSEDGESATVWADGIVEAIGESASRLTHRSRIGGEPHSAMKELVVEEPIPDHSAGFAAMQKAFAQLGPMESVGPLAAFGHRVVHGGDKFAAPAIVDDAVLTAIEACVPLAPLHNPANLAGIRGAMAAHPGVPNVAVFDTAFHQTMAPAAYTYAIDRDVARAHRIRRYGFHGTSHAYVSRVAVSALHLDPSAARVLTLHLGNGASACAIVGGRSLDTSMGLTPLEGLVMGTRSGDLDPAIPLHLQQAAGMSAGEVDSLLNKRSGLKGLCGANDLREIHARADDGDEDAQLALKVYVRRIRNYLAAYLVELGGADVIVFTAGVGEHDFRIRAAVCDGMEWLGVRLDHAANAAVAGHKALVSRPDSDVAIMVVPTDEEYEIARQTAAVLG